MSRDEALSEDALRASALLALDTLGVEDLEGASEEELALVESVLEGLGSTEAAEMHLILEEEVLDARAAHDDWKESAAEEALEDLTLGRE
jgi:hypothetical protein